MHILVWAYTYIRVGPYKYRRKPIRIYVWAYADIGVFKGRVCLYLEHFCRNSKLLRISWISDLKSSYSMEISPLKC